MNTTQRTEILREWSAARRRGDTANEQRLRAVLEEADAAAKAPSGAERNVAESALIGLGRGFTNLWEGGQQLLGMNTPEEDAAIKAERQFWESTPVGESVAGDVGEFLGEGAPLALIPGGVAGSMAARMGTGALAGGAAGALGWVDPTDPGASRIENAAWGAGFGGAIPGALGLVNKGLEIAPALQRERQDLMQLAKDYNVPLMASDLPGASRSLVAAENLIEGQFLGMEKARRAQADAFQKATDLQQARLLREEMAIERAAGLDPLARGGMDVADVTRESAQRQMATQQGIARKLYDDLDRASAVAGPMNATGTRSVLQQAIDEASAGALPDMGAVKQLQAVDDWLKEPRSFGELQRLHSDLRDLTSDYYSGAANQAIGAKGVHVVEKVRKTLEDELNTLAEKSDVPQLGQLWKTARQHYKENVAPYKRPDIAKLTSNNTDADQVLQSFMKRGQLDDRLTRMYQAMDDVGRAAVKRGVLDDAVTFATDPANGAFMPGKFAQYLNDRKGVMGTFFDDDAGLLAGLQKLAGYAKRAGHVDANPPTGMRAIPLLAAWASGGAIPLTAFAVSKVLQSPNGVEMVRKLGSNLSGQQATMYLGMLSRMLQQSENPEEGM